MRIQLANVLVILFLVAACSEDGSPGKAGVDGFSVITKNSVLEIGDENCAYGGSALAQGSDINNNQSLEAGEIADTSYSCNSIDSLGPEYLASAEGIYAGNNATQNVISFKGIKYAAPPIGDLRFRPPEGAVSFSGLAQAADFGEICVQGNGLVPSLTTGVVGAEDCLTLNVFRPAEKGIYPIMVWIHGGGLSTGSSGFSLYSAPYKLVEQGIVVVSINYRLGMFGFLSTARLL